MEMNESKVAEYDKWCEEYINELYHGASGFISYKPGERENAEKENVYLTYGEILFPSFNKILQYMDIKEDDVFYDFGSGVGKVVMQTLLKTPVKKVIGIEANQKRNDVAVQVAKQVRKEFPELLEGREMDCLQKNFLEVDVSDATIIYTCSTLFHPTLLAEIGRIADSCKNLRYMISIPSVKYDYASIPCKYPIENILNIDCSWDKTRCYVYVPPKD